MKRGKGCGLVFTLGFLAPALTGCAEGDGSSPPAASPGTLDTAFG